jgi:hypothetical protein
MLSSLREDADSNESHAVDRDFVVEEAKEWTDLLDVAPVGLAGMVYWPSPSMGRRGWGISTMGRNGHSPKWALNL